MPIVPIGIGGSAKVMPRHAKMIHPSKVHVIIGAPIHVERTATGRVARTAISAVTAELSSELQRLFTEAESRATTLTPRLR